MNDNERSPLSEPDIDPYREGTRGFLFGAVVALVVIGVVYFLF